MLKSSFIIVLVFICGISYASTGDVWKKANNFYNQKQYDSAAACYEQLAITTPADAMLYYNLGNAYYRMNKIGAAVYNYQKALCLNPGYKEAADNLALTESRISNRIPSVSDIFFVKWWHNLTLGRNSTMWSVVSLIIFVIIIALGFLKQFNKGSRIISAQLTGVFIVLLVCFLALAFVSSNHQSHSNLAVVMQNDAPLMNDQHTGKAQSLVPEGTTVTLLEQKGGWAQVRLPDGRVGWIQEGLVNKI